MNRLPNKKNKIIPYELWYKKKSYLGYLKVSECEVVMKFMKPEMKRFGERRIDFIFIIGYVVDSKDYTFFIL